MLINEWLLLERPNEIGGVQRIYRFPNGYGLSAINATMAHVYSYAWEFAVINNVRDDGKFAHLDYSTPLTSNVVVTFSDKEANDFIHKAYNTIGKKE